MRQITRDAGLGGGILALSLTTALTTLWITGLQDRDHQAEATQPRPAPTVTATPAEQTPAPSPRPSRTARDRTVVVAEPAERAAAGRSGRTVAGSRHDSSSASDGSGRGGGRPTTGPLTSAPAERPEGCGSGALSVSARLPRGVRPCAAVSIGGNR